VGLIPHTTLAAIGTSSVAMRAVAECAAPAGLAKQRLDVVNNGTVSRAYALGCTLPRLRRSGTSCRVFLLPTHRYVSCRVLCSSVLDAFAPLCPCALLPSCFNVFLLRCLPLLRHAVPTEYSPRRKPWVSGRHPRPVPCLSPRSPPGRHINSISCTRAPAPNHRVSRAAASHRRADDGRHRFGRHSVVPAGGAAGRG